jgi:CheY-like chemotaxis protein
MQLSVLVVEALEKLASPEARGVILARAFRAAGRDEVPEGPRELASFVGGPLADAVERVLGTGAAEALLLDLQPILRQAEIHSSSVRPRPSAETTQDSEISEVTAVRALHTVLVVDDDDAMRTTIAAGLRSAGHEVIEAGDGLTALALCVRSRPSCVISDLEMPGADGKQLCAAIRMALGDEAPRIVILTGTDATSVAGATLVRHKPIELDELLSLVVEVGG